MVISYLRTLDYVSFSAYSPLNPKYPDGRNLNWRQPTTPEDLTAIANEFKKGFQSWRNELGTNGPAIDVGEFGLGTPDANTPEQDSPGNFLDANHQLKADAKNLRDKYYRGFLKFLTENKDFFKSTSSALCSTHAPITFWTVKQFDFVGLWDNKITDR